MRKANQAYNGPAARTFIKKMQFRKQIFDLLGNIIDELVGGITSEIIEGHGKCTANRCETKVNSLEVGEWRNYTVDCSLMKCCSS